MNYGIYAYHIIIIFTKRNISENSVYFFFFAVVVFVS